MAFPSAVYFIIWKMTQKTILRKLLKLLCWKPALLTLQRKSIKG
jgi:hypothetical protein